MMVFEGVVIEMSKYNKVALRPLFSVTHIIEIQYRAFPKESNIGGGGIHDFWRLFYVDRGSINFSMPDGTTVTLATGEGIFLAPGTAVTTSRSTTQNVNLLTLFFLCPALEESFNKKRFTFDAFERTILASLIQTGRLDFERHSNDPKGPKGQKPKADAPEDTLPFVKASIEYLLLSLHRKKNAKKVESKLPTLKNNLSINMAVEFMYRNTDKKLTVGDIAAHVKMSESNFQSIFRKHTHQSVIEYFHALKIEQAKVLIRQKNHTQSEIAVALGYSTESYFCRHFKQKTGMTPSEYAKLIYYG